MSERASHYPICQFLHRLIEQYGPSRDEFLQSLGYRNMERGRRRLDAWVDDGEGFDRIIKQIATRYPTEAGKLEQAIAATREIKSAERETAWLDQCRAEAATFRPFLNADGSQAVPNGICIFGITGGHSRWTMIDLPEALLDLPIEDQIPALVPYMREYRTEFNGLVPFFGGLTGFKFVRLLDFIQFDADGQFVEHVGRPFRVGGCSVWIA